MGCNLYTQKAEAGALNQVLWIQAPAPGPIPKALYVNPLILSNKGKINICLSVLLS